MLDSEWHLVDTLTVLLTYAFTVQAYRIVHKNWQIYRATVAQVCDASHIRPTPGHKDILTIGYCIILYSSLGSITLV